MISIIVPIYNVEKYLRKCIESIILQNFRALQIILVDDGSPDNCGKICDEYAQQDSRIVVIHQKNQGVSAARNAGLACAEGEYIGFVDPDDWVAPEMYEGMLDVILREQADMVICGYDYYDECGKIDEKRKYQIRSDEIITQKEVMERFSDMPPSIRHGVVNKLFKRDVLCNQKFKIGLHSSEDVLFLNEYVQKIQTAAIVHQPYYKNLVRQGSATHGGLNIESLADSFEAHDQMYQDIIRKYPELKNHSLAFLLDVCTLKYNEAKTKLSLMSDEKKKKLKPRLRKMSRYIRNKGRQALFNKEIFWKTRIMYLLVR